MYFLSSGVKGLNRVALPVFTKCKNHYPEERNLALGLAAAREGPNVSRTGLPSGCTGDYNI